jgi:hypothetical protein
MLIFVGYDPLKIGPIRPRPHPRDFGQRIVVAFELQELRSR